MKLNLHEKFLAKQENTGNSWAGRSYDNKRKSVWCKRVWPTTKQMLGLWNSRLGREQSIGCNYPLSRRFTPIDVLAWIKTENDPRNEWPNYQASFAAVIRMRIPPQNYFGWKVFRKTCNKKYLENGKSEARTDNHEASYQVSWFLY